MECWAREEDGENEKGKEMGEEGERENQSEGGRDGGTERIFSNRWLTPQRPQSREITATFFI